VRSRALRAPAESTVRLWFRLRPHVGLPRKLIANTTPQKIPRRSVSSLDKSYELELANLPLFRRLRSPG